MAALAPIGLLSFKEAVLKTESQIEGNASENWKCLQEMDCDTFGGGERLCYVALLHGKFLYPWKQKRYFHR